MTEDNRRGRDLHNSAEVENPGRSERERESGRHSVSHLVLAKGMFVGRARVEEVVVIRGEKLAAVCLRLVGQEAVMNRVEGTLAGVDHRPRNRHCGQGNCFCSRRRQMNCAG